MPRTPRTQHPRTSVTDADIQAHEPLVYLVLRRMYRTGQIAQWVEHDDLMQAGRIGLWKALKRYDPAAGRFSTFAIPTVWGEMMRYQRDTGPQHGWHRAHGQVAQIDSLHRETTDSSTLGDTLVALDDTQQAAIDRARLAAVHRIARSLKSAERVAAKCVLTDRPQREISDTLGCSQVHASRLTRRVRAKLAAA
jgi:RNA polymerase sigma factor (sigma-70 family)